jgi:myo-inositol-hexaphosphate 3-phosphohydrolase
VTDLVGVVEAREHIDSVVAKHSGNDGLTAWLGDPCTTLTHSVTHSNNTGTESLIHAYTLTLPHSHSLTHTHTLTHSHTHTLTEVEPREGETRTLAIRH